MGKGKGRGQKIYIPNQKEKIKSEEPKKYFIDSDKIKDLDDIKRIFKLLNVHFTPPTNEAYEEYKDILSEVEEDNLK